MSVEELTNDFKRIVNYDTIYFHIKLIKFAQKYLWIDQFRLLVNQLVSNLSPEHKMNSLFDVFQSSLLKHNLFVMFQCDSQRGFDDAVSHDQMLHFFQVFFPAIRIAVILLANRKIAEQIFSSYNST